MSIKKITYVLSNLFTYKKYNDGNLNQQSFEYITTYAVRCSILGAIIQTEGIDKAKELFYKLKNDNIYIQYPKTFKVNGLKMKRFSNTYYKIEANDTLDKIKENSKKNLSTIGFKQYLDMDKIVFYIDNLIPDIDMYLKNIDWLGSTKNMVYLFDNEEATTMDNVLVEWDKKEHTYIFEQYDWEKSVEFEDIYKYTRGYNHKHKKIMCSIKDINLPS